MSRRSLVQEKSRFLTFRSGRGVRAKFGDERSVDDCRVTDFVQSASSSCDYLVPLHEEGNLIIVFSIPL